MTFYESLKLGSKIRVHTKCVWTHKKCAFSHNSTQKTNLDKFPKMLWCFMVSVHKKCIEHTKIKILFGLHQQKNVI